jgi:hypothetical protein
MKIARLCFGLCLALAAMPGLAADAGIVTIVDGSARVLRGTVWYKLVDGAPFLEGDLIDAADRTIVQVELAPGGTLHLVGPASLFAASIPLRNDKLDGAMEFGLERGWLKLVATAPGAGTRLRTATTFVAVNEATIVTRYENRLFELFIESGSARLSEAGRTGREGVSHDAKAGEYWSRDGEKPFTSERGARVKFVAAMPRHLIEKLASLAAKFKGKRPPLAVDREITLAEADPWLTGPYRRTFSRRLGGRLADPAFRKAVEANIAAYPDFDRILHPEKYPAAAPVAGAPAAAAPAAPTPPAAPGAPVKAASPATTPPAKSAVPVPPASNGAPAKPGPRTEMRTAPIMIALAPLDVAGDSL